MQYNRREMKMHLIAVAAVVVAVGLLLRFAGPADAAPEQPDPSSLRIEYRPGGFMPPGFPLEGSVKLLTSPVVQAGERSRVRFEYTVGEAGVAAGEALEIWKHFTSDVEEFQVDAPDSAAHFAVETTAPGAVLRDLIFSNRVQRNKQSAFPYRKTAGVLLESGSLSAGDKVYFDLGGSRGVRMQHYAENLFNFRLVIAGPDGKPRDYVGDAFLKVVGGNASKLRVHAPAYVAVGERFSVEALPSDKWDSLAGDYQDWDLEFADPTLGASPFEYDADLMHYVAPNVFANQAGVYRLEVRSKDGRLQGTSNPIRAEEHPKRRVYFGDLHQHTYLHDGRGVYEELYLHARRNGLLDFGSLTPHHMPLGVTGPSYIFDKFRDPRDHWPDMVRANKRMNGWKDFVTILGYEYSVGTALGGHHNVIFNADEAQTTMQLDPREHRADVGRMMDLLERAGKPAMVIPHVGGGPPNWDHRTDPRIERSFEIASVHGVFEESWQKHLDAGLRLGASASGDNHTVGFGNSYPGLIYTMSNPVTGVFAYDRSRDAIWNGIYERRTFGVTGNQRALMEFSVNGEPMGGELSSAQHESARLWARVAGTEPLTRVELVKNGKVLHAAYPARNRGALARIVWGDNIYQRRANVGLAEGTLQARSGTLRLERYLHRDQEFESMRQDGKGVRWQAATTSNDRDGMLVRLDGAEGSLQFNLQDPHLGAIDVDIPLDALRRDGYYRWTGPGERPIQHSYLKKMGIEAFFEIECELVNAGGPLDLELEFKDLERPEPGDYYYLRMEQLDTNKGWASPVWIN